MIPYNATVRIRNQQNRRTQNWIIPLWLVGLLLVPVGVLLLPLILIVAAVARLNPFPILFAFCRIFFALKGTHIEVDEPHSFVSVHIS
jgi:hypothetical protein